MTQFYAARRSGLTILAEEVASTREGNRNHILYWAAIRAAEEGFQPEDIIATLSEAADAAGLERRETRLTIRSGLNKATRDGLWGTEESPADRVPSPEDLEAFVRQSYPDWPANWPTDDAHWTRYYATHPELGAEPTLTGEVTLQTFYDEILPEPKWLVEHYVPVAGVGGLLGQFKSGKSLAGLQLCIAVASGGMFVGQEVQNPGPTVFIEYEGGRNSLQKRLKAMLPHGIYIGDAAIPLNLLHRPPYKIDTPAGEEWLRAVCSGKVLCVVGPVSKAASIKDENAPAEWQSLSERLQRVVDATGCTIMLVHHTRKPSQQYGPPKKVDDYFNTARGSNSYMGAVDFALGVQREQESAEGLLFVLERDGEAGVHAYDFDRATLAIQASKRPIRRPSKEDKVEATYALISDNPGITRAAIAMAISVGVDTVKGYLTQLADRIVEAGEGNEVRTYRAA